MVGYSTVNSLHHALGEVRRPVLAAAHRDEADHRVVAGGELGQGRALGRPAGAKVTPENSIFASASSSGAAKISSKLGHAVGLLEDEHHVVLARRRW